jgi:MSHA biogenesis protein MshP
MSAMQRMQRSSKGFALMLAIFMIITLAAIGVYLLTISTGQLEAATQDEQGVRAYQAARSGIDWGAYQRLQNSSCAAFQRLTFVQPGLAGFNAEVVCVLVVTETEGAGPVNVYKITATGCNANPCGSATLANAAPTYVERQLELILTQ